MPANPPEGSLQCAEKARKMRQPCGRANEREREGDGSVRARARRVFLEDETAREVSEE